MQRSPTIAGADAKTQEPATGVRASLRLGSRHSSSGLGRRLLRFEKLGPIRDERTLDVLARCDSGGYCAVAARIGALDALESME